MLDLGIKNWKNFHCRKKLSAKGWCWFRAGMNLTRLCLN